ncbi:MAG: YceD family protein [Deltaproteobacteria bacterium]
MKIAVTSLVEGENLFHFDSTKDSWLKELVQEISNEGYQFNTPLRVDANLTKVEPDFYLRGKLCCSVEQSCARCAEVFDLKVNSSFEVALANVPSGKLRSPELTEESEELDINFFEGNEIDLNPIITEQFFLSIPYQALCKPDCLGICQQCGSNLNTKMCQCAEKKSVTPFSVLQEVKLFKQE